MVINLIVPGGISEIGNVTLKIKEVLSIWMALLKELKIKTSNWLIDQPSTDALEKYTNSPGR